MAGQIVGAADTRVAPADTAETENRTDWCEIEYDRSHLFGETRYGFATRQFSNHKAAVADGRTDSGRQPAEGPSFECRKNGKNGSPVH